MSCLWVVCLLGRDFRVLGSRYRIFSVFRERNLCVRVSMRLVDFYRVLVIFREYIMVFGLTLYGFQDDLCGFLWFICHLERDFRVLGSRYRIFSVFRERNLCVRVSMRLVEFLGF